MEKNIANELAMSTGLMGGSDGLEEGLGDFEAEGCTIGAYKTTSTILRSTCSTGTMTLYIYIYIYTYPCIEPRTTLGGLLQYLLFACQLGSAAHQGLGGPRP